MAEKKLNEAEIERIIQEIFTEENWSDCRFRLSDSATIYTEIGEGISIEPAIGIDVNCNDGSKTHASFDNLEGSTIGEVKEDIRRFLKQGLNR